MLFLVLEEQEFDIARFSAPLPRILHAFALEQGSSAMRPTQSGDTGRGPNHVTQSSPIEPLLVTTEETERLIGAGKTTVFALIKKGEIETVLQGRRRMPVFESVKAYVARLRDQAKASIAA